MAGIIEKYASEEVTLLQWPVISDGKTTYPQSIGAKAVVMDFSPLYLPFSADMGYKRDAFIRGMDFEEGRPRRFPERTPERLLE